jgi:AraC-like DNA-binding protein
MKHYEMAEVYFNRALNFLNESNNLLSKAQVYSNLAELYMLKESYFEASAFINKAITIYKDIGNSNRLALCYARRAQISLNIWGVNQAISDAHLAIEHANISGSSTQKNEALQLLSDYYSMLNDYKNAYYYLKKHRNLNDSLFNIERVSLIENLKASYQVNMKEKEINQLKANQDIINMKLNNRKRINLILTISLFLFSLLSVLLFLQYRRIRISYRLLVNKNQEIIEVKTNRIEKHLNESKILALTPEEEKVIKELNAAMSNNKLYLSKDLTLDETAQYLNINRNNLSRIINIYFNINFNNFINQYRIIEACRLMSSPENDNYTIEGIANMSGFSNRQTFYTAFRKNVGVNPSFYMKSIKRM